MNRFVPNRTPCGRTRREFLWEVGGGFAGLALIDLLSRDGLLHAEPTAGPDLLAPKKPHFPAKAKHAVFLFMNGAPSHIDTFDHKPALTRFHGTPYQGPLTVGSNGRPVGYLMQTPFGFRPYGQSGLEISSLFPHTSKFADDLCVIRSMYTDTAAHASGCLQMNTGNIIIGKPSLGSWLSYGLGTENESLPAFVVMTDPRGGPISGASNWTAGYMPAAYQGTLFRSTGAPLLDLATPPGVSAGTQRHSLDLLELGGQRHQHFALAHGHIHGAQVEEGMSKGQDSAAVVIGDRAQPRDAHVAGHQHAGHGVSRLQSILPSGRRLVGVNGPGGPAFGGADAELLEQRPELAQHTGLEAGEDQRRLDRSHQGHLARQVRRGACRHCLRQQFAGHHHFSARRHLVRRACVRRAGLVEIPDLQHVFDGRDAADGIRRENAEAQGHGAN